MTTRERLENALIEFVERASQKEATPAEVQALPEVAAVLERSLSSYGLPRAGTSFAISAILE